MIDANLFQTFPITFVDWSYTENIANALKRYQKVNSKMAVDDEKVILEFERKFDIVVTTSNVLL